MLYCADNHRTKDIALIEDIQKPRKRGALLFVRNIYAEQRLRLHRRYQRARRDALYRGDVFVGEVVHRASDDFYVYLVRLRYRDVHLLEAGAA